MRETKEILYVSGIILVDGVKTTIDGYVVGIESDKIIKEVENYIVVPEPENKNKCIFYLFSEENLSRSAGKRLNCYIKDNDPKYRRLEIAKAKN